LTSVKKHLDLALFSAESDIPMRFTQIENTKQALKKFVKECCANGSEIKAENVFCCIENTGCYGDKAVDVFYTSGIDVWVENAVAIKRSSGIVRGKDDKSDACMIGNYARCFQDKVRLYKPERDALSKLDTLFKYVVLLLLISNS
jgi:transposase